MSFIGHLLSYFDGYRIAFTAVTAVVQAYSAAMAQADFIIPYYGRLEHSGIQASKRISQMADLLHNARLATRMLAASIQTTEDAANALLIELDLDKARDTARRKLMVAKEERLRS